MGPAEEESSNVSSIFINLPVEQELRPRSQSVQLKPLKTKKRRSLAQRRKTTNIVGFRLRTSKRASRKTKTAWEATYDDGFLGVRDRFTIGKWSICPEEGGYNPDMFPGSKRT